MKQLSARAFLLRLLCTLLAVLTVTGGCMAIADPYFHYRERRENTVILGRFALPGLIRNSTYDKILIGSSMCQNFDMDEMEEAFGGEILKATKGGLTIAETTELFDLAHSTNQVTDVYFSADLTRFSTPEPEDKFYADHLLNGPSLDDWRYLFSFEAWMRTLPIDLALFAADKLSFSLPASLAGNTDPDKVGRWAEDAEAAGLYKGEETLVKNYLAGTGSVSAQNPEGLYERLVEGLDAWLEEDPFCEGVTYHFFAVPYSALYWAHTAYTEGSFEAILDFRAYLFRRFSEYDNVICYDFQGIDEICDLSLYKDISHYHQSLNSLMVTMMASGEHLATAEEVEENNRFIRESVEALAAKYPALKK